MDNQVAKAPQKEVTDTSDFLMSGGQFRMHKSTRVCLSVLLSLLALGLAASAWFDYRLWSNAEERLDPVDMLLAGTTKPVSMITIPPSI